MVASVTSLDREKKFCHGELTEAKPERRDITEIPMTPMRSSDASLRLWELSVSEFWPSRRNNHSPLHQKPTSHTVNKTSCKTQILPLLFPENSYPAAEMIEWISRKGMAIIKRKRSSSMVTRNASPRTASLVFDISHSMSSVSTVARATVEAKVMADKRLIIGRAWLALEENGRAYALVFKDWASPERKGKSFWSTNVETSRNVTTKGREEKTIAVKAGIFPGLHSSQSGSMNGCYGGREHAV